MLHLKKIVTTLQSTNLTIGLMFHKETQTSKGTSRMFMAVWCVIKI